MRSLLLILSTLVLLVIGTGCDKSGVHPLGVVRDKAQAATSPTTTWLRSTDTGTEILVVGVNAVGTSPSQATTEPGGLILARATIAHDSSSTLDLGTYTLDGTGAGKFTYDQHYYFNYEPSKMILQRTGSVRNDLSPPTVETVAIADSGTKLLVTFNGTQHIYTNLQELVKSLDATTDTGKTALFRIYNFPLFISQNRLIGFGGAGLTQYINAPGYFGGLVDGRFYVSVDSLTSPTTHITYQSLTDNGTTYFQDVTGVEIQGEQITYVNLSGNGHMGGVLNWTIYGDTRAEVLFQGTIDYSQLQISNGLAAGGSYSFAVEGFDPPIAVPAALALMVDISDVLPVATP